MDCDSSVFLSKRGQYIFNDYDFLTDNLAKTLKNEYHKETNPQGIINLGSSTNRLMESEITERFLRGDTFKFDSRFHQQYFNFSGVSTLKEAVIGFYKKYLDVTNDINTEQITILNGTSACLDVLSHILFDPDDIYITPSPCYARIFTNFNNRSLAVPVELALPAKPNKNNKTFALTSELLENKILELRNQGKTAKGFVLINPQNPLGDIYSHELLHQLLLVCHKYEMHVIIDEIYALSLIGDKSRTNSVLAMKNIPDPNRTHSIWGTSKDMGLPGFRIGVIHTWNIVVQKVLNEISIYNCIPTIVQYAVATFFNDHKWLDEIYFPAFRQRLTKHYEITKKRLEQHGIVVRPSDAGLFVWINLKNFYSNMTLDDEMDLFKELLEAGVYVVPGCQFKCKNPGWFRIVISVVEEELQKGFTIMLKLLQKKVKSYEDQLPDEISNLKVVFG